MVCRERIKYLNNVISEKNFKTARNIVAVGFKFYVMMTFF